LAQVTGVIVFRRLVDREGLKGVAGGRRRRVKSLGDSLLGSVVELRAAQSEHLEAVVVIGVVRRRHHHARPVPLARDDRDARGGEVADVVRLGAAVAKTGEDRTGELGRTLARVVTHEHRYREH